jgi:hypothetical protein
MKLHRVAKTTWMMIVLVSIAGCGPTAALVGGGAALLGVVGWKVTHPPDTSNLPEKPRLVTPAHRDQDVPVKTGLIWKHARRADGYYVYLGRTGLLTESDMIFSTDNAAVTSCDPYDYGVLDFDTKYYWRVDAYNTHGNTSSATREFTTVAANMYPFGIVFSTPGNGSTSFDVSENISVTFNREISQDPLYLNGNSFFITEMGNSTHISALPIAVSADNKTIILTPYFGAPGNGGDLSTTSPLEYDKTYIVTLTTSIRSLENLDNLGGSRLPEDFRIIFSTESQPQLFGVRLITPGDGDNSANANTQVLIKFNMDVEDDTMLPEGHTAALDKALITLNPGVAFDNAARVSGTISYNHRFHAAAFTPDSLLKNDYDYTVSIIGGNGGIVGKDGVPFAYPVYTSHFHTEFAPLLKSSAPRGNNVGVYDNVSAVFYYRVSDGVTTPTIDNTNFYLIFTDEFGCTSQVKGEVICNPSGDPMENKAVFLPFEALEYGTYYTAYLDNSITSIPADGSIPLGNQDCSWTFRTTSPFGIQRVYIYPSGMDLKAYSSDSPLTNQPVVSYLVADFNNSVGGQTATDNTMWLEKYTAMGWEKVAVMTDYPDAYADRIVWKAAVNLEYETTYRLCLSGGEPKQHPPREVVKDRSGNYLSENSSYTFITSPSTTVYLAPVDSTNVSPMLSFVVAVFSRPMQPASADGNFTIEYGSGSSELFGALWSSDYKVLSATLYRVLLSDTTYTIRVTTGMTDNIGNNLPAEIVKTFTTGSTIITTPPTLFSHEATNQLGEYVELENAMNVSGEPSIKFTFSDYMKPSTLVASNPADNTGDSVRLYRKVGLAKQYVSGEMTYECDYSNKRMAAIFTPIGYLDAGNTYYVEVTDQAADLYGNRFDGYGIISDVYFTVDATAPAFSYAAPNSSNTSVNSAFMMSFDEPLKNSSLSGRVTLVVDADNTVVAGTAYSRNNDVIFVPSNVYLLMDTTYRFSVSRNVTDLAGNKLGADHSVVFKTRNDEWFNAALDSFVINYWDGIKLVFNRKINSSTVTYSKYDTGQGTIYLMKCVGGVPVQEIYGKTSVVDDTVIFMPQDDLEAGTEYKIYVKTGVEDRAGNTLQNDLELDFSTSS